MDGYFLSRELCPVCKTGDNKTIYEKAYTTSPLKEYLDSFYTSQGKIEFEFLNNAIFQVKECVHCGLIYQRYIPNDFLMNKLYEEWIDPKIAFEMIMSKANDGYFLYLKKQITNMIKYFGNIQDKLNFLDFGMGWGHWCQIANSLGCCTFGIELSQARIKYAKSLGVNVIGWEEIPQQKYDTINIEQTLEHLSEPLETLTYLKNNLKPDGIIRISVPDGWDIKKRLNIGDWQASKNSKHSLNPIAPLEHINCFNYKALIHIAKIAGLEQINITEKYTISYRDKIKGLLKPIYYLIQGRQGGTTLYFKKSPSY